jgi:hypothetical protein
MLAMSPTATRRWVTATLGELATDDEHHQWLRDTLRLFLRHEGSYTATADTLVMHKNSVKYRNNSAEKPSANPSEPTDSPSNAPSPHATGWVPPSCKNHRRGDPTMNGAVREQPAHLAAATSLPSPTSIHRLTQ